MNDDFRERLHAEFPAQFLGEYGERFYPVAAILAIMAAKGEEQNIVHAAHLLRLLVSAAAVVASEVRKKQEADFKPGWVLN